MFVVQYVVRRSLGELEYVKQRTELHNIVIVGGGGDIVVGTKLIKGGSRVQVCERAHDEVLGRMVPPPATVR